MQGPARQARGRAAPHGARFAQAVWNEADGGNAGGRARSEYDRPRRSKKVVATAVLVLERGIRQPVAELARTLERLVMTRRAGRAAVHIPRQGARAASRLDELRLADAPQLVAVARAVRAGNGRVAVFVVVGRVSNRGQVDKDDGCPERSDEASLHGTSFAERDSTGQADRCVKTRRGAWSTRRSSVSHASLRDSFPMCARCASRVRNYGAEGFTPYPRRLPKLGFLPVPAGDFAWLANFSGREKETAPETNSGGGLRVNLRLGVEVPATRHRSAYAARRRRAASTRPTALMPSKHMLPGSGTAAAEGASLPVKSASNG